MIEKKQEELPNGILATRSLFGGLLMGLANLVPGISGGTMLLVAGVYTNFIESLSDLTRLRFKFRSLLVIGCIAFAAGLGILLFAGAIKSLVVDHRWIMYSLFIGLTLGGLPVVWQLAKPATPSLILSALLAFATMVGLAGLQAYEVMGTGESNFLMLFLAGLAGASAMILPGVSGGYLLLLMGQYVPILTAIDRFKEAIESRDWGSAMDPAISVMLPVGLGVVAGVVLVGNLLKWLLDHFRKPTLGVLIGLLLGSVVGLWPFQEGVMPDVGEIVKGQVVTATSSAQIDPEDWPTTYYRPGLGQVAASICLIAVGFALTQVIAVIGRASSSENLS